MNLPRFNAVMKVKHKLFVSFFHADDERYRSSFANQFRAWYTSKSVEPGEIDTDLSTEYIKRLIREDYISDASVMVVLVGPNTRHRKHVDWEISGALEPTSGRSGLVGILLPEFPLYRNGNYDPSDLPERLAQNADSGYAEIWRWDQIDGDPARLVSVVDTAFSRRTMNHLVRNPDDQMKRDTGP